MKSKQLLVIILIISGVVTNMNAQSLFGFLNNEPESHINFYFSPCAYPFKMPNYYSEGGTARNTELGPAIGFDIPIKKNNFGLKFVYFDGTDNTEVWDYAGHPGYMTISLLDLYIQRQYNIINNLDIYGQTGMVFKFVKGSISGYSLDYSTGGIFIEAGLKYRLPKFLAFKTGFYKSFILKGSSPGYFPFIGINIFI
ncbi:hypothetical protein ACFLT1_08445 [Bacteroidota bacterium]